MEGQRRLILFVLLVTLSSVKGQDFTLTKKAYEAVLRSQTCLDNALKDAKDIKFVQMGNAEELVRVALGEEGIHMVPKNPKTVEAGMSVAKDQKPVRLSDLSIVFRKVPETGTVFGSLLLCFEGPQGGWVWNVLMGPRESCMVALMFSSPQATEDQNYATDIAAKKLNPLSDDQVQNISAGGSTKWSLSSLKKVLSSGVKVVVNPQNDKKHSGFVLNPIIVDRTLLKKYLDLANPSGSVKDLVPSNSQ